MTQGPGATPRPNGWNLRRHSISTQLVLWNILALALLLGALGGIIRYSVLSTIMGSVDKELDARTRPPGGRPPPRPGESRPLGGPAQGDQRRLGEQVQGEVRTPSAPGQFGPPYGFSPEMRGRRQDFRTPQGLPRDRNDDREGARRSASPRDPRGAERGDPRWRPPFPGMRGPRGLTVETNPFRPRWFHLTGQPRDPFRSFTPWDMWAQALAPWDMRALVLAQRGQPVRSTVLVNGQPVRLLSRAFPSGGPYVGVIQAAYPLTDVNRAIAGLDRTLLTLIPVALLCAGLAGALLTGRVLRRVRLMTQAAGRITDRDFSKRIPVTGRDEFSDLAATFNGLLDRLDTALQRQKQLNEQQRRFTADASHELKTPLTIIKGNTSLALSGRAGEESYRQSLSEIDQAAETMSHLVRDLLLLARSDGGQLGQNPIELLLSEIVERAVSHVSHEAASPLPLNIQDGSLSVAGNEEELIRLFSNLLVNAVRHTPKEGRITTEIGRAGAWAVVTIRDTGSGIAPEHLPHLGERFYRVDSSRSRPDGGTGLGLSICKSILEAHGGSMTICSVLGQGTTVTVKLPLRAP